MLWDCLDAASMRMPIRVGPEIIRERPFSFMREGSFFMIIRVLTPPYVAEVFRPYGLGYRTSEERGCHQATVFVLVLMECLLYEFENQDGVLVV